MRKIFILAVLILAGFAFSAYAVDSVLSCEIAVRHHAEEEYHSDAVDFAVDKNQNPGRHDLVNGTFFLSRDVQRANPYRFTCSVNDSNGHVRSVGIVPPGVASVGTANRMMDMEQLDINNCRGAVDENLLGRGYGDVRISSINQGTGAGRNGFISGSATADNGYGSESFGFSCRVDPSNGKVRSVDVFHKGQ